MSARLLWTYPVGLSFGLIHGGVRFANECLYISGQLWAILFAAVLHVQSFGLVVMAEVILIFDSYFRIRIPPWQENPGQRSADADTSPNPPESGAGGTLAWIFFYMHRYVVLAKV